MKKLSLFAAALFFCISGEDLLAQGVFVHPGLLHTQHDIDDIKERLAENDSKTVQAFDVLKNSWVAAKSETEVWGITEYIKRGVAGDENYMNAYRNAAKAYQCALLWKITGEKQWATRALYVLNQYPLITKGLGGNTNQSLIPGFIGYQFLNAAELMRDYDGWAQEDFERFKQWMIDVWFVTAQDFLERRHDTVTREGNWYHYHSNWGLGNALFCVSLGVFADLPDIYNYGMWWIKEGPGNESLYVGESHPWKLDQGMCGYGWGLIPWFHQDDRGPFGYLNQMQESGRDQGHSMAALGLLSYAFQTAYNQGDNAFCNLYNPLVPGMAGSAMVAGAAEYVAMYNCNQVDPADIPYKTNWWMGGLNATGRGQNRPIWQLFVNHYQNRMGIPMEYCTRMTRIVGIESGGNNAYGTNSGGYDHTGYGTLMHNDTTVAEEMKPTILFPEIVESDGEVRPYAEMKGVRSGTKLTLRAVLPDGEADTGNWEWEDGVKGQSRDITVGTSGIYRLYYTNAHGVRSTQMFCISMYGEGIKATLTPWIEYDGGARMTGITEFSAVNGRKVTLGVDYANWNYVSTTIWYDEDGKILGSGGSYTFNQSSSDRTFKVVLTNESGVQISKEFTITNSVMVPHLAVDGEEVDGLRAIIKPGADVVMTAKPTSMRYRNGTYTWSSGEHTDSLIFTDVQSSVFRTLDWLDTTSTVRDYEAHFDFEVKVYHDGQSIEDGLYRLKDRESGNYLNSKTMTFSVPDEGGDSTFMWHITWIDEAAAQRYKIATYNDSAFLADDCELSDRAFSNSRSTYDIYALVGGEEQECFIRTSSRAGSSYWTVDGDALANSGSAEMPSDFPFVLERVQTGGTGISGTVTDGGILDLSFSRDGLVVNAGRAARLTVYALSGAPVMDARLSAGRQTVGLGALPSGVYIARLWDGKTAKTVKFAR